MIKECGLGKGRREEGKGEWTREENDDGKKWVRLGGIDRIREVALLVNCNSSKLPNHRNPPHSYSHINGRHSPRSCSKLQRNVWMRFGYRSGVSGRMWLGTQHRWDIAEFTQTIAIELFFER